MRQQFSKDHFDLFGLPRSYHMDVARLAERYRELQHTIHPDKYTTASDQERRLSLQLTAQVNDAYQTLKNPVLRARYLLFLSGLNPDETNNIAMDPQFLNEQMELRERLSEISGTQNPQYELKQLDDELDRRSLGLQKVLGQLFDTGTADALKTASMLYREMQFIDRLQQEVNDLEMELAIP